MKVKIGGYTDNTGNKEANLKLSQDRATNVMSELVKLGVGASRMEAEGYGEDHPVADNATEEGRAKNRRISLRYRSNHEPQRNKAAENHKGPEFVGPFFGSAFLFSPAFLCALSLCALREAPSALSAVTGSFPRD